MFTVAIVALDEDSLRLLDFAASVLRDTFPDASVAVQSDIYPPKPGFYDPSRGQYRSEPIVEMLASLRGILGVDYVLGIASFDAYADGLNFVFGEALPGHAAVVYTPRLRPEFYGEPGGEQLFLERLEKEVLHEFGHVLGLHHCPNPRCVMRFSNSVWEVDEKEPRYCTRCVSILASRGIRVSTARILAG